jgi:hypothetical protein
VNFTEREAEIIFNNHRDERIYNDGLNAFKRRLSWMYPDDGCWMRAENFAMRSKINFNKSLHKLFVFGNLSVETENSPNGFVSWWFHVVPTARINDQIIVFDPAIEPQHYLKLEDWMQLMNVGHHEVQVSVCHQNAYSPDSKCEKPSPVANWELKSDLERFLQHEWYRMIGLHRDPEVVLGDSPPWLN